MYKLNKKGFTLVELLAVIVILGVIMLIAIPSVGTILTNSRKNSFISSGKIYISTAQNFVAGELIDSTTGKYCMTIGTLTNNKADKSPLVTSANIVGYVEYNAGTNEYIAHISDGTNYADVKINSSRGDVKQAANKYSNTCPSGYTIIK